MFSPGMSKCPKAAHCLMWLPMVVRWLHQATPTRKQSAFSVISFDCFGEGQKAGRENTSQINYLDQIIMQSLRRVQMCTLILFL